MTAELRPFPANRLAGRARHVAALLARKGGRAKNTYWRTTLDNMARLFRKSGLSEAEVADQLELFTNAVNRCASEGWHYPADTNNHHGPGGAA